MSCEIISGYDIQFFDRANNQHVIRHLDTSATFYRLNSVDNASFSLESTSVQVRTFINFGLIIRLSECMLQGFSAISYLLGKINNKDITILVPYV